MRTAPPRLGPGGLCRIGNPVRLTALMRRCRRSITPRFTEPETGGEAGGDAALDRAWFEELVMVLMEDRYPEVMECGDSWDQAVRFSEIFSRREFPLRNEYIEYAGECYHQMEPEEDEDRITGHTFLRRAIPLELMGLTWHGLHDLWDRLNPETAAMMLLARLDPDPAEGGAQWDQEMAGLRQEWLIQANEHIGREILERLPPGGVADTDLRAAVERIPPGGPPLQGMLRAVEWLKHETGSIILDQEWDDEEVGYEEFMDCPWTAANLEMLREDWVNARRILDEVETTRAWLEVDLNGRFAELLDLLLPEGGGDESTQPGDASETIGRKQSDGE